MLCSPSPALAGLDSGGNSIKFRDADGIAAGPVYLVQSSQVVIDPEEVAKDPALHEAIKAHYKKAGIYKRDSETMGGGDSQAFIEAFDRVEVVRVEGNVITVKMVFWWRLEDSIKAATASGNCIVETDGTSYKVLRLETGGKTYGRDGTITN